MRSRSRYLGGRISGRHGSGSFIVDDVVSMLDDSSMIVFGCPSILSRAPRKRKLASATVAMFDFTFLQSPHHIVETVFQAVLHRLVCHAFLSVGCSTIINVHFSRKSHTPTEISASFVHRHGEHSTLFHRSTRCTLFETVTMPNIAVLCARIAEPAKRTGPPSIRL